MKMKSGLLVIDVCITVFPAPFGLAENSDGVAGTKVAYP
jgi:hypothetical protein